MFFSCHFLSVGLSPFIWQLLILVLIHFHHNSSPIHYNSFNFNPHQHDLCPSSLQVSGSLFGQYCWLFSPKISQPKFITQNHYGRRSNSLSRWLCMLFYLYFLFLSACLLWVCCLRQYRDIKINSHPQASVLHQGSSSASLKILWSWNFWELHILDAADKNHSSITHQSSHLTHNHLKPSCNLILNFYSLYSLVIVKLTHFIQVLLCSPSSMPTPLRDSPKSYWTALLNSLSNGQDLSNCS